MKASKPKSRSSELYFSCYLAAIITFAISIYLIFFSPEKELQLQALYWFSIAIFCFILPSTGALIDRINHLRFGEFEINLIEVKKTMDKVEIIFKVDEFLAAETPAFNTTELENSIFLAPASTLTLIYAAAADFREKNIYSVLTALNNDERNSYRNRLYRLIPIFKALTRAQNVAPGMRHHYFAQLAYVYKDLPNPDWKSALENIDKAIQSRGELQLHDLKFGIYEFNRLVCRLNVNKHFQPASYTKEQLLEDFDIVYQDGGCRYMLFGTSESIAPELSVWITSHKETKRKYESWQREHGKRALSA